MSKPKENKSRSRGISLPDDLNEQLQGLADRIGLPKSTVLAMMLRKYLSAFEADVTSLNSIDSRRTDC